MTPTSPTWGDVEDFVKADGWRQVPGKRRGGKRQRHIFFEKTLPDGRVLETHISHDRSATFSSGRFRDVLKCQLEVSRRDFWEAIQAGKPVDRPVETDEEEVVEHPSWAIAVLSGELHMSAEEIAKLAPEEAEAMVHEHWSKPG